MLAPDRERLLPSVRALGSVLNRVVFSGIPTCRGWFDTASPRARLADTLLQLDLHATAPLDRLGPEVVAAGVRRRVHRNGSETWTADPHISLRAWGPVGASASGDEVVRDYAVLLTRSEVLEPGLTIRVTTLPVQLALWCAAHRASRSRMIDSPWIEDVIAVLLARRDAVAELHALPGEVRVVVIDAVAEFAATATSRWVLGRIIVEARSTPSLVDAVLRRLDAVARLPRS